MFEILVPVSSLNLATNQATETEIVPAKTHSPLLEKQAEQPPPLKGSRKLWKGLDRLHY